MPKPLSKQQVRQLLDWYMDMGIDMVVGDTPCPHFTFVPTPIPTASTKKSVPVRTTLPPPQLQPLQSGAVPVSSALQPLSIPSATPTPPPRKKASVSSQKIAEACMSLEELRQALDTWDECSLKITATNTVFCDGNPQAKVMIVGEAPGADEDRQGKPFVGVSGQLLNAALATIGLNRTNVYISNIIPWRPPGNRPPTPQEIAQCLPFVMRHIELIQPKILIMTGGVSTKSLLNSTEGIMKLRGQWRSYQTPGLKEPIRTIAIYHPAFLLRSPGQKAVVWKDLLMIQEELKRL